MAKSLTKSYIFALFQLIGGTVNTLLPVSLYFPIYLQHKTQIGADYSHSQISKAKILIDYIWKWPELSEHLASLDNTAWNWRQNQHSLVHQSLKHLHIIFGGKKKTISNNLSYLQFLWL